MKPLAWLSPRECRSRKLERGVAVAAALVLLAMSCAGSAGRRATQDLLPAGADYDPAIPTPAEVLGFEVGQWHARHDQIVRYFEILAERSPRLVLSDYGRSHEERRLLLATVSAPGNLERLEELRSAHVQAAREGSTPKDTDPPVVVWMGYSVHGNEASGANAALMFAYHLCAARGPDIDRWLEHAIVLVDPCINPDGYSRFAEWTNMHKGKRRVAEAVHREHQEVWPGGRTNHYWFDLNRDWLLQVQPESRARLVEYHRWKPNLLTDFHEMGSGSSFFFQPGIPSRQNPWTPERNLELTRSIASFHAAALDEIGSAYYTEESFDDFYYGKGSTYPDVQGSVGILFEQASSRGALQENSYGPLSFEFTIRNQLRTSLSSIEAAVRLRGDLLEHQRQSAREALELGAGDERAAIVLGETHDARRLCELADLLLRHDIRVHALSNRLSKDGLQFEPGRALVIPLQQSQLRLIESMFEERKEFADHAFYDVSTWNLARAFAVDQRVLGRSELESVLGDRIATVTWPRGQFSDSESAYGWALSWDAVTAPRALTRLLEAEVRVRVATRPFAAEVVGGLRPFAPGTLVVLAGTQSVEMPRIRELLARAAEEDGVDVFALPTGLTARGTDLGSPSIVAVPQVQGVLLVGTGVSANEAGELWFELDQRWELPLTLLDTSDLSRMDWANTTHLFLVGGASSAFEGRSLDRLKQWVRQGGTVIATRNSAVWARRELAGVKSADHDSDAESSSAVLSSVVESPTPSSLPDRARYAEFSEREAEARIAGSIFEAWIDRTHPLAFGVHRDRISLFRASTDTLTPDAENPYADLAQYTNEPHVCGFASDANVARIAGSVAVAAHKVGSGLVVQMVDDPCFRGIWRGGSHLLANAVFFSNAVQNTVHRGATDGTEETASHGHEH